MPRAARLLLRQAHRRHLRIGEHHAGQQPVIHPPPSPRMRDVMRRHLPLLHREMHDLMRPRAIPGRVNVRRAGLHSRVGDDPARLHPDANFLQPQPRRVRASAPWRPESPPSPPGAGRCRIQIQSPCCAPCGRPAPAGSARKSRMPFAPQHFFQRRRRVRVGLAQELPAPLNQRHLHVHPAIELRQFHRHRPAAQNDQRPRQAPAATAPRRSSKNPPPPDPDTAAQTGWSRCR